MRWARAGRRCVTDGAGEPPEDAVLLEVGGNELPFARAREARVVAGAVPPGSIQVAHRLAYHQL